MPAGSDPSPPPLERKLATILSADVAEYSRLMAEDEEGTLRVFQGHRQVFLSLVGMHRGRVFNTAGDAILAEFGSAVEAVRCATEIQAALRTRNDALAPNRQVRFRIGVNLGDVFVQEQDLLGDGVNVAARLQAAAEPGGICLSGSVYDQIRNKLSLSFRSLGEQSFKNIPQPVRTFSIVEAEGLGAMPSPARRAGMPGWAKGAAIAAAFLILAGGYWAYAQHERSEAERAATTQAQAAQAQAEAAKAAAAKAQADETAAVQAAALAKAPLAAQAAEQEATSDPHPHRGGADRPASPPPPQTAALPPARAPLRDGIYAGPICLGRMRLDPARCFRGEARLDHGVISGKWPAREPGVTTFLTGSLGDGGFVRLEMRSENAARIRLSFARLTGTLREGRIDAEGRFLNGRQATLNWQKQ